MSERRAEIAGYRGPLECVGPDGLDTLEATGLYVAEEKHNGCFAESIVIGGTVSEIYSRSGLPLDDAWPLLDLRLRPSGGAVLHGEHLADGAIWIWDAPLLADKDLRDWPLAARRAALEAWYSTVDPAARDDVRLAEQRTMGFRAFFDQIVGRAGEGIVLKAKHSTLATRRADGKLRDWVKVKSRPD